MNKFISQTNTALKKKKKRWTTKGRQVEDDRKDRSRKREGHSNTAA